MTAPHLFGYPQTTQSKQQSVEIGLSDEMEVVSLREACNFGQLQLFFEMDKKNERKQKKTTRSNLTKIE